MVTFYDIPQFTISDFHESGTVSIVCGNREFTVHKDLISHVSPYFKRMFSADSMKEGKERRVVYDDVDPDLFQQFHDWIKATLYQLADQFNVPRFMTYITRGFFNHVCIGSRIPSPETVRFIYTELPDWKICVEAYARIPSADSMACLSVREFASLPPEFLRSVICKMAELRTKPNGDMSGIPNWCSFYTHDTPEEKVECMRWPHRSYKGDPKGLAVSQDSGTEAPRTVHMTDRYGKRARHF